ncbi:MAG: hypothetical protein KC657_09065 [Myxococcales bacterium]|nr:hypothetical protein [Myxococcales bacterium]
MKQGKQSARARAMGAVVAGCAVSSAMFAYAGCSSDETKPGLAPVDPGETFGAEVTLEVVGPGRVLSKEFGGIDCPTSCFETFVFPNKDSRGVPGITLVAKPTEGVRFLGWKLDAAPTASRGRGPSSCQPITRAAATPAVNATALEITLPFGDTKGAPPPGQEAACAADSVVPVAYRVTATFESTSQLDSGLDGSVDGGTGELVFDTPMAGAVGRGIGVTSGRIYWLWDMGGQSAVSTGSAAGGAATVAVPLGTSITQFAVDSHVVFQNAVGQLSVIPSGTTAPIALAGSGTCAAVSSDNSNAYCRTVGPNGQLDSWAAFIGTGPTTMASGLPTGTDLSADISFFFMSDDGAGVANAGVVGSLTRPTDGGAATLTPLAPNRTSPTELQHNTSRIIWLDYDTNTNTGAAFATSRGGGAVTSAIPATVGLRRIAIDPSSTATFFALVQSAAPAGSAILRASALGGTPVTFRSQLTGVGGIAVDSTYLYWTDGSARVFRTRKF